MGKYDYIYDALKKAEEERGKKNINYFMYGLISGIEDDLNKQYVKGLKDINEMNQYKKIVINIKEKGFKILRNSAGKHKVKIKIIGE